MKEVKEVGHLKEELDKSKEGINMYEKGSCKECGNDFEKSTFQNIWYTDLKRKIRSPNKLFCSKKCKVTFFIKRAKARRLEIRPITLVIPDKARAILTDEQIRESKIYNLREIQLLLRGSGLEQ
jgi:hypothetical protein